MNKCKNDEDFSLCKLITFNYDFSLKNDWWIYAQRERNELTEFKTVKDEILLLLR